ncbi:MAG: glycosyltransferase family 2 protein [Coriobacteriaceae bacterium]|nr:glycosyltransferase family 2 protein [Coriobacteriaceae bacterium]
MPTVSVIVPMHNSAEYLAEALASVEMQTLEDIEVICVDDASEDNTKSIYELFAHDDARFRCITFHENRGVSAARNEALRAARGEYVAFLDDDDWYPEKTTLEKLYHAAVEHDAPIAGGSFSEFDNRTNVVREDYTDEGHLSCFTFTEERRFEYRDWQGDFGFQRFIFKRSLLEQNGIEFPNLIRHEDPVFLVRAMVAAGWFYAIPDVVYRYRFHHKPRMLGAESIDDAVEAISEILAISYEHDYQTLRDWQKELLMVYAADSIGLIFNEKEILQARARAIRSVTATKTFRHIADIAGSYKSMLRDVFKQYSLD